MTRDFKLGAVSLAVALILVEGTAGADTVGPRAGAHPLFAALRDGVGNAIQMLTSAGHDVNIVNADGETPLMYAALYSDAAVVARLLERRADPNAKTPGGMTALMMATGDLMKVKLLVERGA